MNHPERDAIDGLKKHEEEQLIDNTLKSTAVDDPDLKESFASVNS